MKRLLFSVLMVSCSSNVHSPLFAYNDDKTAREYKIPFGYALREIEPENQKIFLDILIAEPQFEYYEKTYLWNTEGIQTSTRKQIPINTDILLNKLREVTCVFRLEQIGDLQPSPRKNNAIKRFLVLWRGESNIKFDANSIYVKYRNVIVPLYDIVDSCIQ